MKKLAISLAFAAAASLSLSIVPASAATVRIGPNGVHVTDHHHHVHHRHCYTKKVVTYRHHKKIVKNERVCR